MGKKDEREAKKVMTAWEIEEISDLLAIHEQPTNWTTVYEIIGRVRRCILKKHNDIKFLQKILAKYDK